MLTRNNYRYWLILALILSRKCTFGIKNTTDGDHATGETYTFRINDNLDLNYNYSNNYTMSPDVGKTEEYEVIIKWLQFTMTVVGFIGNSVAYITLSKNGKTFTNPTMLRLLKNQSVLDSLVCFIGGIFVLQPPMWKTSSNVFSYFVCQVNFFAT